MKLRRTATVILVVGAVVAFPSYVALPIVVVLAALIGVLIAAPTVRLRGDYLAIVTLGFGAIASVLVQSDWLM